MRWVIGDVHGMLRQLQTLVNEVRKRDIYAELIFVGDFVNRGPDSKGVIDYLIGLKNARFVRGNHDDVLDLILSDEWKAGENGAFDPLAACVWFLDHGLDRTLMSYGVEYTELEIERERRTKRLLEMVRSAVPRAHKKFIHNLPLLIAEDDLFVSHAWWPGEVDNSPVNAASLVSDPAFCHRVLWHRWQIREITERKAWKRRAFFGHTPVVNYAPQHRDGGLDVMRPVRGHMMTLIDTACVIDKDGRLTAMCVDHDAVVQVDRMAKVVKS